MSGRDLVNGIVAVALAGGALVFIGLLAGFGSGMLTDDPPDVSPYASGETTTTAPAPGAPSTQEIVIVDFAFGPNDVYVPSGTEVTFVNRDQGVPHTSTSDDGIWDSGSLGTGESFVHTFETPGTFTYFCSIHPSMTAKIKVES